MAILDKVFQAAVNFNASDIHVTPGEPSSSAAWENW